MENIKDLENLCKDLNKALYQVKEINRINGGHIRIRDDKMYIGWMCGDAYYRSEEDVAFINFNTIELLIGKEKLAQFMGEFETKLKAEIMKAKEEKEKELGKYRIVKD